MPTAPPGDRACGASTSVLTCAGAVEARRFRGADAAPACGKKFVHRIASRGEPWGGGSGGAGMGGEGKPHGAGRLPPGSADADPAGRGVGRRGPRCPAPRVSPCHPAARGSGLGRGHTLWERHLLAGHFSCIAINKHTGG